VYILHSHYSCFKSFLDKCLFWIKCQQKVEMSPLAMLKMDTEQTANDGEPLKFPASCSFIPLVPKGDISIL